MANFQFATLLAGLIAAAVTLGTFIWQRRKDKKTLRNALFAELRHIRQHYGYAGPELRRDCKTPKLTKRLKWAKLGEVITVKDLSRYAILGAGEMQQLLQISLRVRNTDLLIDMLLGNVATIADEDVDEVCERMDYVVRSVNKLITYMEHKDSSLASIAEPE